MSHLYEEFFLRIPAKYKYLDVATSISREICVRNEHLVPTKNLIHDIQLCISEACTNAIKYGSLQKPTGTVSIKVSIFSDKLILRIGDQGHGFDLEHVPQPDLATHPDSGYGIFLIRAKMDEVRYIRGVEENHLEMIRYLPSGSMRS